jgi:single-strand DNA-binding protein
MINRLTIMGRVTVDPELKCTKDGKYFCRFSIAVQKNFKNKDGEYGTDFFDVVVWDKLAETFVQYFSKGQRILLEGVLENNNYTDRDNVKHYKNQIRMTNMHIIDPKTTQQTTQQNPQSTPPTPQQIPPQEYKISTEEYEHDFEELLDEGDIPF